MDDTTPASPSPAPAPAPAAPSWLRAHRLALILGTLLLIVAAVVWFGGRETTLQSLARKLASRSNGTLTIDGVTGSLYGRMHIDRIVLRSPERVVTALDIDIDWSPANLLAQQVAANALRVANLNVQQLAASKEPLTLPTTLAPPYGMRINLKEAEIKHVLMIADGKRTAIDDVHFRLTGDKTQWVLHDASASTPWGKLRAGLTAGAKKPFSLAGSAYLAAKGAQAEAAVAGNLSDMRLSFLGRGRGGNADIKLRVAPFEAIMLRAVKVDAQGVNPFLWDKTWPKADFKAAIDAELTEAGVVRGTALIENRLDPGPIDKQQVPLRKLTAQLRGNLKLFRLDDVLLDFGGAGKLVGAGTITGEPGSAGNTRFALHTDRIDLKGFVSTLHTTRIAGDIVLSNTGKTAQLNAHLAQNGFLLDARASLAEGVLTVQQAQLRARGSSILASGVAELSGQRPFKASGSVAKLNPADFGDYPPADINATFAATGNAGEAWKVAGEFALKPSQLFKRPLSGQGKLQADARHIDHIAVQVGLGNNKLSAQGAFGAPGDKLVWQLAGSELGVLQAGLDGTLTASGVATGTYAAPSSTYTLAARGLRWLEARDRSAPGPRNSSLNAAGTVALRDGVASFSARGQARAFDPSAFSALASLPEGRINGDFQASGRLGASWAGNANLELLPSTLLGSPLSGYARVAADARQISRADLDLSLAANRLTAQGKFGGPGDVLNWRLAAPQLAALGNGFGGAVQASGTLAGTRAAPAVRVNATGTALQLFGKHRIASVKLDVAASSVPDTPLSASLALTGYRTDVPVFDALNVDLTGTSGNHTLRASAKNPQFDASTELAGQWRDGDWRGALRTLQNRGRYAVALQAPAPLRFAVLRDAKGAVQLDSFALTAATLALPKGLVNIQTIEKNGPHWKTSGTAAGVPATYLAQFSQPLEQVVAGDMTLGGSWTVDLGAELNGAVRIARESGDLALGADLPVLLGLTRFDASLNLARNSLEAQFDVQGTRPGAVHVDASTRLVQQDGKWQVGADSPLRVNGNASMASIAWLAPLVGPVGLELNGSLGLVFIGSGTVGTPKLEGRVAGEQLSVSWPDQGVKLRNGELRANLQGEQLVLETLRFDGEEGTLRVEGGARFSDAAPTMQLKLAADKLQLLSRPDRILVVSGNATANMANKKLQIDGKFKADRAEIELARQRGGVTMSDDVVVVRGGVKPKPVQTKAGTALGVDVELDLGDRFHLSGMGLDATLAGTVAVHSRAGELPRATGTIRVDKGTYQAYGQDLIIERGVLNFNGPLDNPSINILAMRRNEDKTRLFGGAGELAVDAGVEVRGTARAPAAKLVSTPNVSDSEKLSWLVLGHGTAGSSAKEFDALGAAATALLSSKQAAALQGKLAGSLGVDAIGVTTANGLENTVLTVGKRLSQRAYLTFERGASNASNLIKLNYQLTQRIVLQVQAGANTAFDVLYTWAFD
ncbi:MAG TPA: translocation/assembly module TamB domain-containing protein [Burkholderiaceae bacterium]